MVVLSLTGSGYVDFEKYEACIKEYLRKKECEHRIYNKAFRKFDKNGDGSVSYEELTEVFLARGKSEKDVQDFINEADTDKDGQVDYEGILSLIIPSTNNIVTELYAYLEYHNYVDLNLSRVTQKTIASSRT